MAAPPLGARMSRPLCLDAAAIRAGALQVCDRNPLHHDDAFAAASRYGELIASGAHTAALLAGSLSEGFGDEHADGLGHVGMEYQVRFEGPVRVGRPMRLEWVVAALEPRRSGTVARLEGSIVDAATGATALSARMTILYFGPRPPEGGTPAR